MKTILIAAIIVLGVEISNSQTTLPQDSFASRFAQQQADEHFLSVPPQKPNEMTVNGRAYEGIFVQMAKTSNPLELINPAAPPEYGSSEDNVVFDPITGNASGLKLFSVRF